MIWVGVYNINKYALDKKKCIYMAITTVKSVIVIIKKDTSYHCNKYDICDSHIPYYCV